LTGLAARDDVTVAILTGRSLADIRRRFARTLPTKKRKRARSTAKGRARTPE